MEIKEKIIIYINMIHNIVNIYTIYVIYQLFQSCELAYAITLVTLFAVCQIFTVYKRIYDSDSYFYTIIDFFQIGFILKLFCQKQFDLSLDSELNKMMWLTTFPQLIIHFIIYFCLGIPINSSVSEQPQLAPFINFILLIFLLINFAVIYYKYFSYNHDDTPFLKILLQNSFKIFSYYMSLCSLSFLEDSLGINLLYYQLVLMFLACIAIYYLSSNINPYTSFQYKIRSIFIFFLQVEYTEQNHDYFMFNDYLQTKLENLIFSLQYLSQLIRVVLIVVFYDWNIIDDLSKQYRDIIQEVCLFCSLISSILYFFYFLSSFISVLQAKYIVINTLSDLKKGINQLNKKLQFTSIIVIHSPEYSSLIQLDDYDIELQLCLEFWQGVSRQLKSQKQVQISFQLIDFKLYELFGEVENVPQQQLVNLQPVDSSCFMRRFENGFILNKTSNSLIFSKRNINLNFSHLVSNSLSITLFYKMQQKYIPIMPAQVLYDLYD